MITRTATLVPSHHFRWLITALLCLTVLAPGALAQSQQAPDPETVLPNFIVAADSVDAVAEQLELLSGKTVIRSIALPKVSVYFNSKGPIKVHKAIHVLESLLASNGIAIISMGDYLKAVQATDVQRQAPDMILGTTLEMYPSLKYYQKQYDLDYLDAITEAKPMIQSLMSNASQVIDLPKSNSLLITDMLTNLQRIETILLEADIPEDRDFEVYFYDVEYIKAQELQQKLKGIIESDSPIARYFDKNTVIDSDERTNKLIVLTHPSNKSQIDTIVESLDEDVEPNTALEAFYLKHAEATAVQGVLDALISGQQQAAQQNESTSNRANRQNDQATNPANSSSGESNLSFSEYINVVADERANAIFATGTKSDLKQLAELIEKIDVLLPQVRIEVVIADVQLNEGQISGLDSFSFNLGADGIVDFSGVSFGALDFGRLQIDPNQGPLDTFDLAASVGFSRTKSNVEILSVPAIMTQHNQPGSINVSEQRPLVGSTTVTDGGATSDVNFESVGIDLSVTPLIGSDGLIQMEITQTIENFGQESFNVSPNAQEQPNIFTREASAFVSVQSGDTVVLGGLRQREVRDNEDSLFLLGDLPLLGPIFRRNRDTGNTQELIIFLRPTVVNSPIDAKEMTKEIINDLDLSGPTTKTFIETNRTDHMKMPEYDPFKIKEVLGVKDVEREQPEKKRHGPRR